ncbi:tetratricopeptide repeat protein [Umezawaea sp. Da 62-37]|uniref:tetratricopeptide repeat protein n=1 Tax=Umezawaea sp. Da 62-37 TaxID=3075927 RepID=UPI0028F749B6|nr:tetratricopeptide repeat protein [Umezawaea sp. Da 62-37]WNV85329.1 tetratricopeptide repeat protein [Umezawaea sp. Da 62-37]
MSYRKVDLRLIAAALHQFLAGRLGTTSVFMDHTSMSSGEIYPPALRAALARARVLLVLVGPNWLADDPGTPGKRLVDRESDWVRREIREALRAGIEIIPVLVDGATLPKPGSLPADIEAVTMRQTTTLQYRTLAADYARLVDAIAERAPELLLADLFDEEQLLSADPMPSELLRSEHRVVGYVPDDERLADLTSWLAEANPFAVRLITGPGGCGKTRLATELVLEAKESGWQAGFVREDVDADTIGRVATVRSPLLLVVDYAEGQSHQLATLVAAALDRQAAVRVLLLARSSGQWQRTLQRHRTSRIADLFTEVPADAITAIDVERERLFYTAARAFANKLDIELGSPVTPPDDLDDARFDRMLDIHAAALASVLDIRSPGPLSDRDDPVRRVLHHEENHWLRTAADHGLAPRTDVLRVAVAASTLVGADRPATARAVLGAVRGIGDGAAVAGYLRWLTELYPGPAALNPLRPDRLGEDLVAAVLAEEEYPDLAKDLSTGLDEGQLARAVVVLARSLPRHPDVRGAVVDLLSDEPAKRIPIAMVVATQVDSPPLVDVLSELSGDELAPVIVDSLPDGTLALAAFAVVHTRALLRIESRRTPVSEVFVAELRHDLSVRLTGIGDFDQALVTSAEAVRDYEALMTRGLADADDLARALTTKANALSRIGLCRDAVPVATAAVDLVGGPEALPTDDPRLDDHELLRTRTDALTTLADLQHELGEVDQAISAITQAVANARVLLKAAGTEHDVLESTGALASALETLASIRESHDDLRDALRTNQEAVGHYQDLDDVEPDRYRSELIRALGNLAGTHAHLREWPEGAALGEKAVALARSLVAAHGDTHLERLADTLNNTAALLRRLKRHEKALEYLEEAVPLYRGLADRLPGVHRIALADALHNFGNCLGELGKWHQAVDAYDEGVEIHRKLPDPTPDQEADQAEMLVGWAHALVALDDDEEALLLTAEAVDLLDRSLRVDRTRTRIKLVHALYLSSATAFDLDRFDQAVRDGRRAVALRSGMGVDHDPETRREHAGALHVLARALDAKEDHPRSASVFAHALAVQREIPLDEDGDEVRSELAGILLDAGVCLSSLGDHPGALRHSEEAVAIRHDLLTDDPRTRFELAEALNNVADAHCDTEDWAPAKTVAAEAIAIASALHDEHAAGSGELLVFALVTGARSAGPDGKAEATTLLRRAWRTAGSDDRELVREWAGRLGIPLRRLKER